LGIEFAGVTWPTPQHCSYIIIFIAMKPSCSEEKGWTYVYIGDIQIPVYLLTRRGDRVGHLKTLIVFSFNPQAAYHVMKAKICHGRESEWGGKGDPAAICGKRVP